ncbi:unnamed protein product [Lampetra planeri]
MRLPVSHSPGTPFKPAVASSRRMEMQSPLLSVQRGKRRGSELWLMQLLWVHWCWLTALASHVCRGSTGRLCLVCESGLRLGTARRFRSSGDADIATRTSWAKRKWRLPAVPELAAVFPRT